MLISWRREGAAGGERPLRLLDAPGPALLRQNLAWMLTESSPGPAGLARIAEAGPARVLCLFDLDALPEALRDCRALAEAGRSLVAVRGRVVPAEAVALFDELSFAPGLLEMLPGEAPARWEHPVVLAESCFGHAPLGAVFSCAPEPGVLDVSDVGRAGRREGASRAGLAQHTDPAELDALGRAFDRAGAVGALLVDNGGDPRALADALASRGRLRAWLGPASRPVPEAALRAGADVFLWFEPEDLDAETPALQRGARGCAFVPVGLPGEDIPAATVRLMELRARGFAVLAPRFHVPVPNTAEWRDLALRYPLPASVAVALDGSRKVFPVAGYEPIAGPELLAAWSRDNVRPAPPPTVSLRELRDALDRFAAASAADGAPHARDLMATLLAALPRAPGGLAPLDRYPFVTLHGADLVALIDRALDARLRSLDGVPEPLLRAMQRATLGGAKRVRPVLAMVIACAFEAPLDAALTAALAPEWLHAASLIQDDLPSMDDDPVRRAEASAHARHGEGIALLASDALVALAIEDLASLAEHPRVGADRAVAMVRAAARALGAAGLVGGQASDLLLRDGPPPDLAALVAVHARKTAPLFGLAAALATQVAGVEPARAAALVALLEGMGVAFQIVDDALDNAPDRPASGRPGGSDARRRRANAVTALTEAGARRYAAETLAPLLAVALEVPVLAPLARLAQFVVERDR